MADYMFTGIDHLMRHIEDLIRMEADWSADIIMDSANVEISRMTTKELTSFMVQSLNKDDQDEICKVMVDFLDKLEVPFIDDRVKYEKQGVYMRLLFTKWELPLWTSEDA